MSADSEQMELNDGAKSPTPSEEATLLHETGENVSDSKLPPKKEKKRGIANLGDIKRIINANDQGSSDDLTISLNTGEVIKKLPNKRRIRNRTSNQRTDAKNGGKSNVNPHDRVKNDDPASSSSSKRTMEHGDTPPNVIQSAKKPNVDKLGTPVTTEVKQSNTESKTDSVELAANRGNQLSGSDESKSSRKRKRAKRSKAQKAGENQTSSSKETPANQNTQSSGSGTSSVNSNQPITSDEVQTHEKPSDANDDATFAETVKSYCMAIIDQRTPGQMQLLNDDKVNKINALLTDIMFTSAGSSNVMPAFEDTRLHSGAMRLRCANEYTLKWLERTIPTLDNKKLWTGAKLVLIAFKDIPKPHKFNVVVRNVQKSPKDIFVLLEKQNVGISTKSWTVLSHYKKGNDTHMTIGVGQDSFDALRGQSNSLYCGMGKALFYIVKKCTENQNMLHSRANEKSNSTPVVDQLPNQQIANRSTTDGVEPMELQVTEAVDKPPEGAGVMDK